MSATLQAQQDLAKHVSMYQFLVRCDDETKCVLEWYDPKEWQVWRYLQHTDPDHRPDPIKTVILGHYASIAKVNEALRGTNLGELMDVNFGSTPPRISGVVFYHDAHAERQDNQFWQALKRAKPVIGDILWHLNEKPYEPLHMSYADKKTLTDLLNNLQQGV